MHQEIELPQGTIRYRDSGPGPDPDHPLPVVVFIHGLLVDSQLWDGVLEELHGELRCIAPDLPLGSHQIALRDGADRTPGGMADLIGDFLEAMDLENVTLVANDTGGALSQILVTRRPERIGRLVLTPCDAFENFLPLMFRPLQWAAKVPGLLKLALQTQRLALGRRLAFMVLTKEPIPDDLLRAWAMPALRDPGVFRDVRALLRTIDPRYTLEAAQRLADFDRPVLLAWAPGERFFPYAHARRLADILPDARVEAVQDARTFLPFDQPAALAQLIRDFVRQPPRVPQPGPGASRPGTPQPA
jgi:pimeloyl-ACP methyl ester carboxylesterase